MRRRVLFAIIAGACGALSMACALVSGASDLEVVDGPVTPAETGSSSGTSSSSSSSSTSSSSASSSSSGGPKKDAQVDDAKSDSDANPTCTVVAYGPYRCSTATGTAWQTPLEACAKDGTPAVSQGSPFPLALAAFDFAIPDGAEIEGIKVEITRRWTLNTIPQSTFGFRNKGSTKSSGAWTSSYTTVSYGGATDKWGTTWQASDFTAGLTFQLEVGANGYANVDDVAVTVYACP